jgi:hypothetical protein
VCEQEKLTLDLMQQIAVVDDHDAPIPSLHVLHNGKALWDALAGVESTRVVLASALLRIGILRLAP